MNAIRVLAISAMVWVAGCESRSTKVSITAEELLKAQGGQLFTVTIPEAVDPKSLSGLALKYPDGSISPLGSANSFEPGQDLKVIVFGPRQGVLRYAFLGDGSSVQGESLDFPSFGISSPSPVSAGLGVDQPLIRFGKTSVSMPPAKLEEGQFDLVFHIQTPGGD